MQKNIIACAVAMILANYAHAADYTVPIYLHEKIISAGDTIKEKTEGIIGDSRNKGKTPINLGTGSISVTLDNQHQTVPSAYGIKLEDDLNHNLGNSSSIKIQNTKSTGGLYGLSIKGSSSTQPSIKAHGINIEVKNEATGYSKGISIRETDLDLGSGSKINVVGRNEWDTQGIFIENSSNLTATELTIQANTGYALSIDTSSTAKLGNNTKIYGEKYGINILSPTVENGSLSSTLIADNNLYVNTTGYAGYAINSSGGNNIINLGNNATIETSGINAQAIRLSGYDSNQSTLTAKNLNIKTTGMNATALYISQGSADITGATINTLAENSHGVHIDSVNKGPASVTLKHGLLNVKNGHGIISIGDKSTANLTNTTINLENNLSNQIHGLRNRLGGKITASNTTIKGDGDHNIIGVYAAENNSLTTLKDEVNIDIKGTNGIALLTESNGIIKLDNVKAKITGGIAAQSGGKINLDTTDGSVVTARIGRSTDSSVTWIGKGTTWNIVGNSIIDTLNFTNNSNVNFAHSTNYNQVTVGELSGSSNFNFKIDFDNNQKDLLKVTNSSSGNHTVSLVNNGSSNTNGTEKITIIETSDGQATFKAAGKYEFGGYLYGVRRENNDPTSNNWEVASIGDKTDPAKASASAVVGNYLINLAEQEHLRQRMSDLHVDNSKYGSWVRTYGGKFKSFDSSELSGFDMNYSGVQLGTDAQIYHTANANWHLGGALAYTTSDQNYRSGDGKQKSYSGTLYATYVTDNDWYADFYLKYAHYKNKLNIRDSQGQKAKGDGSSDGLTASAEAGKRFTINEQFFLEPSVQLVAGNIDSGTINNSNGLKVSFDTQNSFTTRVGSKLGYKASIANQPINLYAKINYAHEFDGKQKYKLNQQKEELKFGGSRFEYGLGASILINNAHSIFMEANGSAGNRFDQYGFNLGYKYNF